MESEEVQEVEWRAVPGWEGWYEVSNTGLVRSVDRTIHVLAPHNRGIGPRRFRGRELRRGTTKKGYELVSFTRPGEKRFCVYVHDLVLLAFVGPKPEGLEVCHNDGTRRNTLENLRYDTRRANAQDRIRHRLEREQAVSRHTD